MNIKDVHLSGGCHVVILGAGASIAATMRDAEIHGLKLPSMNNLPDVVFHSLRHTSITYKLKLNGGDIKSVQGDSGHSQVDMVTDVYSHIIDEDRRRNAELFEQAFYEKKIPDPRMRETSKIGEGELLSDVDADLIAKVLAKPELKALLVSLARAIE